MLNVRKREKTPRASPLSDRRNTFWSSRNTIGIDETCSEKMIQICGLPLKEISVVRRQQTSNVSTYQQRTN